MNIANQGNTYLPPPPPNQYVRLPEIPETSSSKFNEGSSKKESSSKSSNNAHLNMPYRPVSEKLS